MAEHQISVALRRITNFSSITHDGNNRFIITLQNGDRLIVIYREISGTNYPHGITFEFTPMSSSEIGRSATDGLTYECTIRSQLLQSGMDFQITQFNQYMAILQSI